MLVQDLFENRMHDAYSVFQQLASAVHNSQDVDLKIGHEMMPIQAWQARFLLGQYKSLAKRQGPDAAMRFLADYNAITAALDAMDSRLAQMKRMPGSLPGQRGVAEGNLNEFDPSGFNGGGDGESERSRRLRKLLKIAIEAAEKHKVGSMDKILAMNTIAGDDFFSIAVEGILPDITDREYMYVIESAYKTVKQGVAEGIQFLPIDKFPKTDDENQSELYLKTKDGNVYVGEWDSASGYFFATDIVHGNHPAGNELPGRMYNRPVAFAVKQGVAEGYEDDDNECYTCRGTGEGQHEGASCPSCGGSGIVRPTRDDDNFDIPDDMDEGAIEPKNLQRYHAVDTGRWPDDSNSLADRTIEIPNIDAVRAGTAAPNKHFQSTPFRTNGVKIATKVKPSITKTTVDRLDRNTTVPDFLKKSTTKEDARPGPLERTARHTQKKTVDQLAHLQALNGLEETVSLMRAANRRISENLSIMSEAGSPAQQAAIAIAMKKAGKKPKHMSEQPLAEKWSQKYKSSINCSHPKGFSQRAHCAGKKKHTESIEMEMVCEDCGMCETHGDHTRDTLDEACWKGYHKEGNKKLFGKTVPNCVKNEDAMNEFAPGSGDDHEPNEEEILFRLAKQWWLGTEKDMIRVERTLASMGWEIGEDEGYDDGGVFVVRAGDVNGNSYISWPHEDLTEGVAEEKCPHCSGPMFSELMMTEKKDACYYKVKSRYKVWPSAYASGALVKCRKRGAANWGNKVTESLVQELEENLHDWFGKEKWVRMDTKGNIKGDCAREPGEGKPKCLPAAKAHALGKKGRASAAQRKRRQDPNPERHGAAINVATKKKSNEDYNKGMKMADYVAQADRLHDEMMRCQHENDQTGYERAKQAYLELERQARQGMVPETAGTTAATMPPSPAAAAQAKAIVQKAADDRAISLANVARVVPNNVAEASGAWPFADINEVSDATLTSYKQKAHKSAEQLSAAGQHRAATDRYGNIMKATGKQIDRTTKNIARALGKK